MGDGNVHIQEWGNNNKENSNEESDYGKNDAKENYDEKMRKRKMMVGS